MKKIVTMLLILITGSLLFGQNAEKKWAIGLGGGYYHNLEATDANGLIGEVYFSRYLSPSFDLMANLNLGYTFAALSSNGDVTTDLGNLFLNLRYKFNNGKLLPADNKIQPFIYAGPGYLSDNKSTGINFDAGLGAKYMLSKSWSLFAEVGYIHGIDGLRTVAQNNVSTEVDCHDNFIKAVVGIEYAFGKKKDADGDGVADSNDKCPNTPKKAKVDKSGCPIDSDGDGIFDGLDRCPDEKGILANEGCPFNESEVEWLKIKVKSIFFDTNMSDITDESKDRMKELVELMLDNPGYNVNVYGFADPRGDAQANLALSNRRAQAAVQYLISKGIGANRITSEALGESHSGKENLTAEELQNERRVDFNLYK